MTHRGHRSGRPRLALTQVLLGTSLVAVVVATPLLTFVEYSALTRTVDDFGLAQNVTGNLADAQRDALLTVIAVERLDTDAATAAGAAEAVESLSDQLAFLGQQLRILESQDLPAATRGGVRDAVGAYTSLDRDVSELEAGPLTVEAVAAARPALGVGAGHVQDALQGLYSGVENSFYAALSDQLSVRRDRQVFVLGSAVLALLLGTGLAQSLVRSVGRDFARSLALLEAEEAQRAAAQEAAERTDRRFRALVQSSSDAILVVGDDLRVAYANPTAADLMGFSDDLRGALFSDLVASESRAASDSAIVRSMQRPGVRVDVELVLPAGLILEARVTNLVGDPAVRGLVVNAHDITDRAEHARALEHLAYHDRLTGLPNRLALERALDQPSISEGATVLVLDVDGFGAVNEQWGQADGDAALTRLADRLRRVPGVTAYHLGGDEFALLASGADACARPAALVEDARHAVEGPITAGEHRVSLTAGLGVASAGSGATRPGALLRLADAAMQSAKRRGRGGVVVLDEEDARAAEEHTRLAEALARAVDQGDLTLAYQPIVDATTRAWTSVEALLRWTGPDGPVPPSTFVPIAEATGLIQRIGRWVLEESVRTLALLREATCQPLTVNVNVSAHQLREPDFLEHVASCLRAAALEPSALVLELTESAVLEDPVHAARVLGAVRAMGVAVALDDFGTGYSSLAYLLRLPVSTVKMDRSFVGDLTTSSRHRTLLGALVAIAHDLGMRVTVEGVETEEAMAAVVASGCDTVQGYLVTRPLPVDLLLDLFHRTGSGMDVQVPRPRGRVDGATPVTS